MHAMACDDPNLRERIRALIGGKDDEFDEVEPSALENLLDAMEQAQKAGNRGEVERMRTILRAKLTGRSPE